jgi:hypothetical protein
LPYGRQSQIAAQSLDGTRLRKHSFCGTQNLFGNGAAERVGQLAVVLAEATQRLGERFLVTRSELGECQREATGTLWLPLPTIQSTESLLCPSIAWTHIHDATEDSDRRRAIPTSSSQVRTCDEGLDVQGIALTPTLGKLARFGQIAAFRIEI